MCDAPTSGDDKLEFAAAQAAGWSSEDLEWEITQECAAKCMDEGDVTGALGYWKTGLSLARSHFSLDDPRFGTSLANWAFGLRTEGHDRAAATCFAESLKVWSTYGLWVQAMPLEQRARSSLFHLRMELRHREQYDRSARERLQRFGEEAHKAIVDLAAGMAPWSRGYSRWRAEKPATFGERRKFLSACLLLVSRSSRQSDTET